MAAEQPDLELRQTAAGQHGVDDDAVPARRAEWGAVTLTRTRPARPDAERRASVEIGRRPRPLAPVTAMSPALMIGAFSPPIAVRVEPRTLVIALDVRDRRDPEIEDVRRIEASAHPDFDDREVDPPARQLDDGRGGESLELRGRTDLGRHPVDRRQDAFDRSGEVGAGDSPSSRSARGS